MIKTRLFYKIYKGSGNEIKHQLFIANVDIKSELNVSFIQQW